MSSTTPADRLSPELREARLEIVRLRTLCGNAESARKEAELQLAAEKAQNHRYIEQLNALRNTRSWKITWPIRALKRGQLRLQKR